jgi:hypothetical protein
MGERPLGKTLERKNNNLGYCPQNCCWASPVEQSRNRHNSKLTLSAAVEIATRALSGEPQANIAHDFAITQSTVSAIVTAKAWKDALITAKHLLAQRANDTQILCPI